PAAAAIAGKGSGGRCRRGARLADGPYRGKVLREESAGVLALDGCSARYLPISAAIAAQRRRNWSWRRCWEGLAGPARRSETLVEEAPGVLALDRGRPGYLTVSATIAWLGRYRSAGWERSGR